MSLNQARGRVNIAWIALAILAIGSQVVDAIEKQTAAQNIAALADRIAKADASSQVKRLRMHALFHLGDMSSGETLLSEIGEVSGLAEELKVQRDLLQYRIDPHGGARKRVEQLANSPKQPSSATQALLLLEARSSGPESGRFQIIDEEPFWVPALLGIFQYWGKHWLGLASPEYGGRLFDITERKSHVGIKIRVIVNRQLQGGVGEAELSLDDVITKFRRASQDKEWNNRDADKRRVEALLRYHFGASEEATAAYEDIVSRGEGWASTYYRLARLYESSGRQKDAEATIQAGLKKFPEKNSILLVTAAEYAAKRGEVDEAISLLNKCLAASPEYPPAHILLAELEAQRGNRDAAIKACADTLAFSYGWDGDFLDRVNGVLEKLVQLQEAKKETGK